MKKLVAGAALALATLGAPLSAEAAGNLASGVTEFVIDISGSGPTLSANTFQMETGKYYRVVMNSDGAAEFMFSSPDLMPNIHIRLVVIEGIEVHLQGLTFRGIEFDEGGSASFSFVPIRPGTYNFSIGPATGTFVVQ